jgi:hypothetical protein
MKEDHSLSKLDSSRKVVSLRGGAVHQELRMRRLAAKSGPSVLGLEQYEHSHENDRDFRHRMLVNIVAGVVAAALIIAGTWVVNTLAETTHFAQFRK